MIQFKSKQQNLGRKTMITYYTHTYTFACLHTNTQTHTYSHVHANTSNIQTAENVVTQLESMMHTSIDSPFLFIHFLNEYRSFILRAMA